MTILKKPTVGTDSEKGWRFYSLHMATSFVLREYFLVSNYRQSIKLSEKHGDNIENVVKQQEKFKGQRLPYSVQMIAGAKELSSWAVLMEKENYHDLYVHSFIGMWSSFESGLENIVADFIFRERTIALEVSGLFKAGRYEIEIWPWDKSTCLEIAQKLESKAKRDSENGGIDLFSRLKTLLAWLDIHINLDEDNIAALSEANRMRNILLHRYGEISEKDALDFPTFSKWEGKVMPFSKDIFNRYYNGITSTFIALMKGIQTKVDRET